MLRVVADANILVAALVSPNGAPAEVFRRWVDGAFDLLVSTRLLDELAHALAYPKLRARVTRDEAAAFVDRLSANAIVVTDPAESPRLVPDDPDDDYLIAIARAGGAHLLISGDRHLLEAAIPKPRVVTARALLSFLDSETSG